MAYRIEYSDQSRIGGPVWEEVATFDDQQEAEKYYQREIYPTKSRDDRYQITEITPEMPADRPASRTHPDVAGGTYTTVINPQTGEEQVISDNETTRFFQYQQEQEAKKAISEAVQRSLRSKQEQVSIYEKQADIAGPIAVEASREQTAEGILRKFRELPPVFQTPELLKEVSIISSEQRGDTNAIKSSSDGASIFYSDSSVLPGGVLVQEKAEGKTRSRVERLEKSQQLFFGSPGFKRIEEAASFLTGGQGQPYEQRGYLGKSAQVWAKNILSIVPGMAGTAYYGAQKLASFGDVFFNIPEARGEVLKELARPATSREFYSQLNPATPEGLSNIATAATFAFFPAARGYKPERVSIKTDIFKQPQVELEKTATTSKYGSIATTDEGIVIRKEGDLTFQYPRSKVLEASVGKNAPTVAVSTGDIIKGGSEYQLRAVQVGREISGNLLGKGEDILFKKTPEGKIQLKYIRKDFVTKIKEMPAQPENMKFQRTNAIQTKVMAQDRFDIGQGIEGENTFFDFRAMQRQGKYKAVAGQQEFIGGRDINKRFYGETKTTLTQSDRASLQKEVQQVGGSKTITYRYSNIKYSLQPKYEPNIKIFKEISQTGIEEPVVISEYTQRPQLFTERRNKFISSTLYEAEKSRIKPLKFLYKSVEGMNKKGQIQFSKGVVDIETLKPKIKLLKPETEPVLSLGEIDYILGKRRGSQILFSIPTKQEKISEKQDIFLNPVTSTKTEYETNFKPLVDVKLYIQPKTNVQPKIESITQPKSIVRTNSIIETKPLTEIKSDVAIKALTETRTQTKTEGEIQTKTQARTKTFPKIKIPPVPPIIPPIFDIGSLDLSSSSNTITRGYDVYIKRKQLKEAKGKYQSRGYAKANTQPLSRVEALGLGADITDRYVNRSFYLKPSSKPSVPRPELSLRWQQLRNKFTTLKSNRNILKEKSKFAIDSLEEKKGIPYEALRLKKQSALKRSISLMPLGGVNSRKKASAKQFIGGKSKKRKEVNVKWI